MAIWGKAMTRREMAGLVLAAFAAVSCGAKTGLLVPDASVEPDAGMDAGTDAGVCVPGPLALERRGAQILFAIDRSNSMFDTLDGRPPAPGEPRRWDLLRETLEVVLRDADPLLEFGAEFYPLPPPIATTPEEACRVDARIDLPPGRGTSDELLSFFRLTQPAGGTPTALGLKAARDYFESRPATRIPRFVVLATDGGPNCNPDTGIPHTRCVCTGSPDMCITDPNFGPYNCLDDVRTIDVIRGLFEELHIPVYVIGMDDPTRPDLADVLDRMAIAGGRPREEPGERRFYSVRRPDDLRGALETITESISRCVFNLTPVPAADALVHVRVDGVFIPHDPTRTEGWDFTSASRSEITLFGGACERVMQTGAEVVAELACRTGEE
jgi:hypothetical protein